MQSPASELAMVFTCGGDQLPAQPVGVFHTQSQCCRKYARLVLALLVLGTEAIVPQFRNVHNRSLGIG